MSTQAAFRLTSATNGLTKLLPVAEAEIMRAFWAQGTLSGRAVHTAIAARRNVAYTTIMTTCGHLFAKGLLRRTLVERSCRYVYTPTISERAFVTRAIAGILDRLARDYPTVLAHELDTRREHATN
jgi:predicted transcriptional regulator